MKLKVAIRASVAAVLMVLVCSTIAQSQPVRAFVKGAVTQGGKPARSVWVVVSQGGREGSRTLTGDDGKYYIGNLNSGTYDIVVLSGKKESYRGKVTLPRDKAFDIRI